ncbi:MAG: hypothetical protein Q9168_007328 [Polycauliona sp. 1 TL-2023]
MSARRKHSDSENSVKGSGSSVFGPGARASIRPVLATTWRGQTVEVTLPYPEHPVPRGDWWEPGDVSHYIHSTAPPKNPNIPRGFQRVPEQERHKRRTDINNPYVRIQTPTPSKSRTPAMAGGHGSLNVPKPRTRTASKMRSYNQSTRHSSLLDTDLDMEAWPVVGSSSGTTEAKPAAETEVKIEQKTVMGQLLDFAEPTPEEPGNIEEKHEAPKKSLMQQLYELQGLEVDAVSTTITTTTTVTSIKSKPSSTITPPRHVHDTKKYEEQAGTPQSTPGGITVEDSSASENHDGHIGQPDLAATTNTNSLSMSPPGSVQISHDHNHDHDPSTGGTTDTEDTPSSLSPSPQTSSPPTALDTIRAQELANETNTPLGTEISTWAAGKDTAPSQRGEDISKDDGGYVKRFTTRRGKTSESEPNPENAVVKWDPFGGLWGYAVAKKVWVVATEKAKAEEKKEKEDDDMSKKKVAKGEESEIQIMELLERLLRIEEEKKKKEEKPMEAEGEAENEAENEQQLAEQTRRMTTKDEVEQRENHVKEAIEVDDQACFDQLESFWIKKDEEPQKEKEGEQKHSYFDDLECFLNS